jgi:hypothetical protein
MSVSPAVLAMQHRSKLLKHVAAMLGAEAAVRRRIVLSTPLPRLSADWLTDKVCRSLRLRPRLSSLLPRRRSWRELYQSCRVRCCSSACPRGPSPRPCGQPAAAGRRRFLPGLTPPCQQCILRSLSVEARRQTRLALVAHTKRHSRWCVHQPVPGTKSWSVDASS